MSRRQRDRDQRRAAANERIGHENAYMIVYGKMWAMLGLVVCAVVGATWVHKHVDPLALARGTAFALLAAAAVILVPYTAWLLHLLASTNRVLRRYTVAATPWWPHLTAIAGGLLVVAGILVLP